MPANFYKYKFVLTGGGTGGHIMPLIAMYNYLQEYPVDILYIGEINGREQKITHDNGINFKGILAGKWRRYLDVEAILDNIIDVFKVVIGFFQAVYYLYQYQPNAILSKGGYVSLPVVAAGRLLRIPILVHESDIVMGLTNKTAAKYAQCVATGFPVENYPKTGKEMVYTGIPIDRDLFDTTPKDGDFDFFGFDKRHAVLLITGGIQGAHAINEAVKGCLQDLVKHWQVIHLCGEGDYQGLCEKRSKLDHLKDRYAVFPYLGKERISAMRIADMVISRASATTMAELAAMGRPLILIPLPTAASDHQNKNAKVFENEGAALILDEKELTPKTLYDTIESLKDDRSQRNAMTKALGQFSKPEAGKLVMEKLIQLIHN